MHWEKTDFTKILHCCLCVMIFGVILMSFIILCILQNFYNGYVWSVSCGPILCNSMDCSQLGSFCPWYFPGKNTGVGCHFLLQGIFLIQGSNPHLLCLLHCRQNFYLLGHGGSPFIMSIIFVMRKPVNVTFIDCKRVSEKHNSKLVDKHITHKYVCILWGFIL